MAHMCLNTCVWVKLQHAELVCDMSSDVWNSILLGITEAWCLQEHEKCIRDDVNLAQLVRARECQSRGRRFDSGKNSKNQELKSTWI